MSEATHPWWASSPEPVADDDAGPPAVDDTDPVEAFRAARRPRPVPPRAAGRGATAPGVTPPRSDRTCGPDGEPEGALGMDGTGRQAREAPHRPELCGVCPLCTLARALEDTRPELLDHLTEAARHLAAAARSLLDAGPADPGPADPGPADPGPADPGPADTGPADTGPVDTAPTASRRPAAGHGPARRPRGEVERIPLDPRGPVDPGRAGGGT